MCRGNHKSLTGWSRWNIGEHTKPIHKKGGHDINCMHHEVATLDCPLVVISGRFGPSLQLAVVEAVFISVGRSSPSPEGTRAAGDKGQG